MQLQWRLVGCTCTALVSSIPCLPLGPQAGEHLSRICKNVLFHANSSPRLGAALLAFGFVERVMTDT